MEDLVYKLQHYEYPDMVDIPCGIFEPTPGFVGEPCETISQLMHRMSLGEDVQEFGEGVYQDEQFFDSEFMDEFDVMDGVAAMLPESELGKVQHADSKKEVESANADSTPPGNE